MATVEQLAQALAEVRTQLGEAQRLASDAQRASVTTTPGGQSVAAMVNLEPAMEGAFKGLVEKPLAELTLVMRPSAKQTQSEDKR